MIKIRINNIQNENQEYLDAVLDKVAFRVSILQKSLSHLNGDRIVFGDDDFRSFKPITRDIITIVGENVNLGAGRDGYTDAITNCLGRRNNLGRINLAGLLRFCQDRLANNNRELSALLTCEAAELMNVNRTLLQNYGLNTNENIAVLKLAFNYDRYSDDIATHIKAYFRRKEFVKICPYCNIGNARHRVNDFNEDVDSYQLDHFYDKATYPLLAYSFCNLIPCDYTCNVTNKGTFQFSEVNHLNPHEQGYANRIKFIPLGMTASLKVSKIQVQILEAQGTPLYARINGNNLPDVERYKLGNLNAFKIRSRYEEETDKAKDTLEKLHANNKNIKHIWKFLKGLSRENLQNSHIEWYKEKINKSFYPDTFNDNSFSKFHRDIHDHYYSESKTRFNKYIITLIEQNQ